ncbi:LysE family translocator [Spiribacter pallidus]|uniref:LysE family translocator n=1 Tax=Spiribacter pallidus TaxID=1987936 RepID=A0ABV3TAU1_9GAMM
MTPAEWLSLAAVCLLGALSPGPSLAVVMGNTLRQGTAAGIATALSHGLMVGGYALATALGLAALIAGSPGVYNLLALAGAAYLLWLGASALRAGDGATAEGSTTAARPGPSAGLGGACRDGLAIALFNPKIAVFFLALFSQFVTPGAPWPVVLGLAATAMIVDAGWYALVATVLSRSGAARWLRRHQRWLDRLTGVVLVGLALTTVVGVAGG